MRPSRTPLPAVRRALILLVAGVLGSFGCGPPTDPRPSIVLIVVDTLRASAVSAYGKVEGTTPGIDALAAESLDYRSAWAPAPWTLPSHASLLTGLGVDLHGVGLGGLLSLPAEIDTIAERLSAAGYDTAAFSENMLVSDTFQLLQGFAYRRHDQVYKKQDTNLPAAVYFKLDLERHVGEWFEQRDKSRPFFLFVNVFDAHNPYLVRDENPWVKEGLSKTEMARYAKEPQRSLCDHLPNAADLATLHGLYLGDVAAADRKVAGLRELIARHRRSGRPLITVLTSDHGELFGERRLLGHEFSLRNSLLHVPLIVHGLPEPPGVIEARVTLMDLAASVLAWAGIEAPESLEGRPLPTPSDMSPEPVPLFAAYSDSFVIRPDAWTGVIEFHDKGFPRRGCGEADKVFGTMGALVDPPYKLHWFERYEPELYDLRWDPDERFDIARHHPERVERYGARIEARLAASSGDGPAVELSPEAAEALRSLGYIDD